MTTAELTTNSFSNNEFHFFLEHHPGNIEAAFDEIEDFLDCLNHDMVLLERQTRRHDPLTVASIAYRLKKQAKEFGIELLQQSASQIETSARKNRAGQLAAEIDLLRFQVGLLAQSAQLQKDSLNHQSPNN